MNIIPAILESELEQIENKLHRVVGLVDMVQIDMCDGVYVPSVTFGWRGGGAAATLVSEVYKHGFALQLDLMLDFKNNQNLLDEWLAIITTYKPKEVIFHCTSVTDWNQIFDTIDERSTKIYLAVHLQDPIPDTLHLYSQYNFKGIQVMGIEHVGFSGEQFHTKALEYIQEFSRHGITVLVDGGVKQENLQRIKDAGASGIGVNSGLFAAQDIGAGFAKLVKISAGEITDQLI